MNMENLKIGTKVKLTDIAKEETYMDMDWRNDNLEITHKEKDGEGMGYIYSFDSLSSNKEITCSMYGYELELI
jgi:hypothetical protein